MRKSLFFKSAFILLIGSLVTRMLGFVIRIVFTRIIGTDGINLYSLVMPTYSLLISLTQLGLPMAISTVVAKGVKRGKKVIVSVAPIILILNLFMVFTVLFSAEFIATNLLDEPSAKYPIMSMSLVLPFISISSMLRGYFFGKQKMFPHTMSNAIEQIVRLTIIILFLPRLISMGTIYGVCGFILLSAISEIISIVVFLFFLPKNFHMQKDDFKPDIDTTREVLNICLPSVSGRLVGNVAYFLEPVILTYTLKAVGYSNSFIVGEYGIYNAYVLPLLVIPSFIVQAISTALVPEVSKAYQNRDIITIKKRLKQSLKLSLFLGLFANTLVFIFAEYLLKLVYNTTSGALYIRVLSLFFVIYNMEGPLSGALQALGQTKLAFKSTTIGVISRTLSILIISLFNVGIYGLVVGEILDIVVVVVLHYKHLIDSIKKIKV